MSEKRVYTFGNGQAEGNAQMREKLGGKGANLAEMNLIGIPVPPGFTIATDVCNEYYEVGQEKITELLQDEVNAAVAHIEKLMNSNDSIQNICEECGFSSFSQFSRIFRKICGITPREYRQLYQNGYETAPGKADDGQ